MPEASYLNRYREELDQLRADYPILTGDKIAQRCHTLSLLLTAAVCDGEVASPDQLAAMAPLLEAQPAAAAAVSAGSI